MNVTSTSTETSEEPQTLPTQEGYDLWAHIYDEEDNPLIALETPLVRRLLGGVKGLSVADIGYGTGRYIVSLAQAGAKVVGVDFSQGMMAKAHQKADAFNVQLVRHNIRLGLPFKASTFDRVICCLVLEHLANLDTAIGEMARISRPGGFVLISDLHPAMFLRDIQAQFRDPETGRKVRPNSTRHQISDYVMAATRAGLSIDHMSEQIADQNLLDSSPRARKYWAAHKEDFDLGWPMLLLMRLKKA